MDVFEQACQYFKLGRQSKDSANYLFYLPREKKAYIGLGFHKVLRYQRDGLYIHSEGASTYIPSVLSDPLSDMANLLDDGYPSFWLISPDLYSSMDDPALPLVLCIQPKLEIQLTDFATSNALLKPLSGEPAHDWQTQSDEFFLERLSKGITVLQDYPDGKMIITRGYQREIGESDPFLLFKIFAESEPMAACSHYLQIDESTISFGCSPENVFEMLDGRLVFDVVAGTRGISADPEVDAKWLRTLETDPKERREHLMAFDRYKRRIEPMIEPGSLKVDYQLQLLQLGNVRHLHSRLSGNFKPEWDWLKLLINSCPALASYPEEVKKISENKDEPLRFYGGVFGRVAAGGHEAAFYLNLRAALVKNEILYTQGGVGVINESVAEKELLEVKNKLSGLMKAVAVWESQYLH